MLFLEPLDVDDWGDEDDDDMDVDDNDAGDQDNDPLSIEDSELSAGAPNYNQVRLEITHSFDFLL